jgi:hypothetical protein
MKYLSMPKLHTSQYTDPWQISQHMGEWFIVFSERFIVQRRSCMPLIRSSMYFMTTAIISGDGQLPVSSLLSMLTFSCLSVDSNLNSIEHGRLWLIIENILRSVQSQ